MTTPKNMKINKRAWDIISKFIYDSCFMDVERKFKAQEAANILYDDDEYKELQGMP